MRGWCGGKGLPSNDGISAAMKRISLKTPMRPALLGMLGLLMTGLGVPSTLGQDPFAEGGAEKAATKSGKEKGPANVDVRPREPELILQIRENNPTTGVQLVEAAKLTLDFGRPDEAKKYLAKAIELKMDEAQLEDLAKKFGIDLFVRLTTTNVVRPEGDKFGRAVLLAHEKATKDPARQAKLLAELSADSEEALRLTRGQLSELGLDIAPVLIAALDAPASEKVAVQLQLTLLQLGPDVNPALIAVLGHGSSSQQIHVLQLIGQRRISAALPQVSSLAIQASGDEAVRKAAEDALLKLMPRVPSSQEVESILYRQAQELLKGEKRLPEDANGLVTVWTWNESEKTVKPAKQLQRDAAVFAAKDLVQTLTTLSPKNNVFTVLNRVCRMEVEGILEASDGTVPPAVSEIPQADIPQIEKALDYALKNSLNVAARKAATALGKAGDPSVLRRPGGGESPLVRAIVHKDVRVRLAASLAAIELSKGEAFVGSSRMLDVLGTISASGGTSRVLICEARKTAAADLAAIMLGMGFEASTVFNGKDALRRVATQADIDFALIDDAVEGPRVIEMVQLLRRDFHSAGLPIAVLTREENAQKLEFEFSEDPLTIIVPRIYQSESAGLQLKKLEALAGRNLVLPEERIQHAQSALQALLKLLKSGRSSLLHELHRQEPQVVVALESPSLTPIAAEVLAELASPAAQTALVEYASIVANPLELRQQAAQRFAEAIKRRGLLLTRKQIMDQYSRYNASESLDAGTQAVLGQLIDALESRAVPVGGLTAETSKTTTPATAPAEGEPAAER